MPPPTTLAAALVRDLRAHGARPAGIGPGAPTWSEVADRARRLGLGLAAAGWGERRVAVMPSGDPVRDLERELAVLAVGGVLALPGAEVESTLGDGVLRPGEGPEVAIDDLLDRGARADEREPAGAERRLAGLVPDAAAVVDRRRVVTHGEALWALRAVARWLGPALGPAGPGVVLDGAGPTGPALPAALVGRWWPAAAGARLTPTPSGAEAVAEAGAEVVLLAPDGWAELAQLLRRRAVGSLGGGLLLHRGRLVVAGESRARRDRAALHLARWWAGERVRAGAGLAGLRLGLALAPVDPGTTRDLAAAAVPFTPTWCEDGVAAPLAAGPVGRPAPDGTWARPLPGRRLELGGPATTAHGGDLPVDGLALRRTGRVDGRGRVALPRSRPGAVAAGARR